MRFLFDAKPSPQAELFAEACSLIDDGLDPDFVLGLYPEESEWLGPMLGISTGVAGAIETEQPSFFFEASLKSKFLAAAREQREMSRSGPLAAGYAPVSQVRTALASAGVVFAAGVMGVVTLAFVTSDDAVPGDWNYSVKLAQERIEYSLARGDGKVDVQINHVGERVQEIRDRGENASTNDIKRLEKELAELERLARDKQFDALQKAQLDAMAKNVRAVLSTVSDQASPEAVKDANAAADGVLGAAGVSDGSTLTPVPVSPTPATTPEATPTPPRTETETATPAPTESTTPTASATEPLEQATPTATQLP